MLDDASTPRPSSSPRGAGYTPLCIHPPQRARHTQAGHTTPTTGHSPAGLPGMRGDQAIEFPVLTVIVYGGCGPVRRSVLGAVIPRVKEPLSWASYRVFSHVAKYAASRPSVLPKYNTSHAEEPGKEHAGSTGARHLDTPAARTGGESPGSRVRAGAGDAGDGGVGAWRGCERGGGPLSVVGRSEWVLCGDVRMVVGGCGSSSPGSRSDTGPSSLGHEQSDNGDLLRWWGCTLRVSVAISTVQDATTDPNARHCSARPWSRIASSQQSDQ